MRTLRILSRSAGSKVQPNRVSFFIIFLTHTHTNTRTDTDKDTVRIRSAQFEVFFTRIGKNFGTETETDDTPTSTVVTCPRLKASRPKPAKQSPKPREGD